MATHGSGDLPKPDLQEAGQASTANAVRKVAHTREDDECQSKEHTAYHKAIGHVADKITKDKEDE